MKRGLFLPIFFFIGFAVFSQANDEMYNRARLLIYGEDAVTDASKLSDQDLRALGRYGLGTSEYSNVRQLNSNDSWLLSFLINNELRRRNTRSKNDFLLYIQERNEMIEAMDLNATTGRAAGWLMVLETAIRLDILPVGRQ